MGFCNSCGRPIVREDYGTNKDGSPNDEFCIDCYQNGEYTEPDITLDEMIELAKNEASEEAQSTVFNAEENAKKEAESITSQAEKDVESIKNDARKNIDEAASIIVKNIL